MNPQNVAALINLLGFITGAILYAMLLAMVLRASAAPSSNTQRAEGSAARLLLATALLGLLWNLGALVIYGLRDWSMGRPSPWFESFVFTSLGFLPAVVVHSVLHAGLARSKGGRVIASLAYTLSTIAGLLHFYAVGINRETPSPLALRTLTIGFSALSVILLVYAQRSSIWKRALWVVALSVFAVSALHLSQHTNLDAPWIELIGHHASLPLVLAMLYQDYRFALADIFLKRAMALVALVALAFGLYLFFAVPLLRMRDTSGDLSPVAVGALIGLWLGTALAYPLLRRGVVWFVDTVVLRRVNYQVLRDDLARLAALSEDSTKILDQACQRLAQAFTAKDARWLQHAESVVSDPFGHTHSHELLLPSQVVRLTDQDLETASSRTGRLRRPAVTVLIPTHERPRYSLVIGELSGGRQLLSDDTALLESVALMLARRIDAIRVTHERCERNLREQEISKLATEAELRALRAQLNPHFLFNALTTISYLIQTSPDRALETLMRLTGLLRAVLRAPTGEMISIGEETDLIESYLAIERARFEERLRVVIDVPHELRALPIPPLLVQPLVENAIKHGVTPCKLGGDVIVSARIMDNGNSLCISVRDTGAGSNDIAFAQGRKRGVGLANVQRRLECFYGPAATLDFRSRQGEGTTVELRFPIHAQSETESEFQPEPVRAQAVRG